LKKKALTVTPSSGNVFADLGFENPEQELLNAKRTRPARMAVKEAVDVALARGIADTAAGRGLPVDVAFAKLRAELAETGPELTDAERLAVIRARIRRSLDDPRPSLSSEEVDTHLKALFAAAEKAAR
jgi:hypothetical protein